MNAISKSLRRTLRQGLEALGWLGPFYRARERQIAKQASGWRGVDAGLPTPPPVLVAKVVGHADLDGFIQQGEEIAAFVDRMAQRHGASARRGDVLDFGCGCGRVARHLAPEVTSSGGGYFGLDINRALIGWCDSALPGSYRVNPLRPPTPLPAASLDVLFSVSVFTHMPREAMQAWLAEFARLLRPNGLALVSFADEARAALADGGRGDDVLSPTLVQEGFAVSTRALEGSNFMSSYVTATAFRTMASELFDVLEVASSPETNQSLAWAALRKPNSA